MKHDYNIYKDNHPDIPKDVLSMFDPGFFGVEKDYRNKNHPYLLKRKKNANLLYSKKSTTKNISRER